MSKSHARNYRTPVAVPVLTAVAAFTLAVTLAVLVYGDAPNSTISALRAGLVAVCAVCSALCAHHGTHTFPQWRGALAGTVVGFSVSAVVIPAAVLL